ncbi:MAG: hypothetical protein IPP96_09635 [Chitinophagaceae bacterium]|nr:hypothetical protein [Chitinophagaceae bacterium]
MVVAVKIALILGSVYLVMGMIFAIFFLSRGIEKMDTAAHGSGFGFRMIILPGTIALWPVLLKKWMNIKKIRHDKTAS